MNLILHKDINEFIESLEHSTQGKWLRSIMLLREYGSELGMPHSRNLGHSLHELRIRGKQEIRAFYTIKDDLIIILHVFIKKTQKIPTHELELALIRLQNLT